MSSINEKLARAQLGLVDAETKQRDEIAAIEREIAERTADERAWGAFSDADEDAFLRACAGEPTLRPSLYAARQRLAAAKQAPPPWVTEQLRRNQRSKELAAIEDKLSVTHQKLVALDAEFGIAESSMSDADWRRRKPQLSQQRAHIVAEIAEMERIRAGLGGYSQRAR